VNRVRYKSPDLCAQATYRRCGGDIQRVVILVSTSQIGGLFGHDDCREMVPLRIPNPDSLESRNKEVSLLVDFDSVGDTVKKAIFLSHVRQDDRFTFCRLTVCTLFAPLGTTQFLGRMN